MKANISKSHFLVNKKNENAIRLGNMEIIVSMKSYQELKIIQKLILMNI